MITSLGVVVLLIVAVMVLRQPQQSVDSTASISGTPQASIQEISQSTRQPAAEHQETKTDVSPSPPSRKQDESHEKISGILDTVSDTVSSRAPSLWDGVRNVWSWLLGFDTKHLVILVIIIFVFLGSIGNISSGSKKKENGR
ncbi:hypothetical protein NLX82_19740 [Paenibacillus sp. A3M_27_13]|nr:hypothetical protein [Paenibacillus sp. A3M_27_13]